VILQDDKDDAGASRSAAALPPIAFEDALITRLDLRRQISLFETSFKMRISPSGKPEELHEAEQNDRKFQLQEHRRFLIMIDAQMTATAWAIKLAR
jgi:hypothetical protein